MFQYGQITPALGMKILLQFDKSVNNSLATRVKSKITFKVNCFRLRIRNLHYIHILISLSVTVGISRNWFVKR